MKPLNHLVTTSNLFFESETAKVYYDVNLDTLFLEYLSKVKNHAEFVEINSAVLSAFKKLSTQKFVADIRYMGIIAIDSQKWVVENLLKGMLKHLKGKPLHHAQLIDHSEIFSKVSGSNIKSNSKDQLDGLLVSQFAKREELEEYLKEL